MRGTVFNLMVTREIGVPVPLLTLPVEPAEIEGMLQRGNLSASLYDFIRVAQEGESKEWLTISVVSARGERARYILARDVIEVENNGAVRVGNHSLSVCYMASKMPVIALVSLPAASVEGGIAPRAQLAARITGDMLGRVFWGGVRAGGGLTVFTGLASAAMGAIMFPISPPLGSTMIASAGLDMAVGAIAGAMAGKRKRTATESAASAVKEIFAHSYISRSFEPLANMVGVAERDGNTLRVTGYRSTAVRSRGTIGGREKGIFVSGAPTEDAIRVFREFSKETGSEVWVYVPTPGQARIITCSRGRIRETRGHIPPGVTRVLVREILFGRPEGVEIVEGEGINEVLNPPLAPDTGD